MAKIKETVEYDYRADTTNFEKNVNKAEKSQKNLNSGVGGFVSKAGPYVASIAAATAGIVALGAKTTEVVGIQNTITAAFGESEEAAKSYIDEIAGMLSVPTQDFEFYASKIALTAKNYGFAEEEAQKFGIAAGQLSATLASYLGLPVADVTDRIAAAMRGEAEAAEALGLTLNETTVQNYALSAGAQVAWKDMSEQEKMTWRLYTAIDQVAKIMGVEIETVNDASSAIEALNKLTETASTQTTNFQKAIKEIIDAFNDFIEKITPLVEIFFGFLLAIMAVWTAIKEFLQPAIDALKTAFGNLMVAIEPLLPILGLLFGSFVVVSVIIWQGLILAITKLIEWITIAVEWFLAWYEEAELLQFILEKIVEIIKITFDIITNFIDRIKGVIDSIKEWAEESKLLQIILEAIATAVDLISSAIIFLLEKLEEAIVAFRNFRDEFNLFGDFINLGGEEGTFNFGSDSTIQANQFLSGASFEAAALASPNSNYTSGAGMGTTSTINKSENTTNNFNIQTNEVMDFKTAKRKARISAALGVLV